MVAKVLSRIPIPTMVAPWRSWRVQSLLKHRLPFRESLQVSAEELGIRVSKAPRPRPQENT